ncbi:unnamed protein product [Pedinophyceae sp. YPF-701]|nr:unnamed protein product [Pedinophyceae sp. YPF-701]
MERAARRGDSASGRSESRAAVRRRPRVRPGGRRTGPVLHDEFRERFVHAREQLAGPAQLPRLRIEGRGAQEQRRHQQEHAGLRLQRTQQQLQERRHVDVQRHVLRPLHRLVVDERDDGLREVQKRARQLRRALRVRSTGAALVSVGRGAAA